MPPDSETTEEKSRKNVEDLFKTVLGTSGIMLALLVGLTKGDKASAALSLIRFASIILVISITCSILGLQFIVAQLQGNKSNISRSSSVAWTFLFAWISFIFGCVLLIITIFTIA